MIYYFVPDYPEASWGIGMLYQHVYLLRRNGLDAMVLHERDPAPLDWLTVEVPFTTLQAEAFNPKPGDVLVVSEVFAANSALRRIPCRRLVFVQGSFLMLANLPGAEDYRNLGFEHALVILPHMKAIVEKHFGVDASVVPPLVAPYFFVDRTALSANCRERRILLYPKAGYLKAGLPDYDIVARLVRRRIAQEQGLATAWKLVELKDLCHQEVAQLMQASAFFINVNSLEGFNTTVPEAMAAGCIPLCYDAFGGRDFLSDGENAYVFPNHYAYPLLDKLLDLMDQYEHIQEEISRIRMQGYTTACQYTEVHTERALMKFYTAFLA